MQSAASPTISLEGMLSNYQEMKAPTRVVVVIDLGATPTDPATWILTTDRGKDANSIYLMQGDEVQWKLKDPTVAQGFSIDFKTESPLESGRSVGVQSAQSPSYAVYHPSSGPWDQVVRYSYDITITGYGTLDPDVVVGGPGNRNR